MPKALAPKDLVKIFEGAERTVLPAWDPMVRAPVQFRFHNRFNAHIMPLFRALLLDALEIYLSSHPSPSSSLVEHSRHPTFIKMNTIP